MYKSSYAESFEGVRKDMVEVRRAAMSGSMTPDVAEAVTKAAFVEVKAADVDIRGILVEHKTSRAIPHEPQKSLPKKGKAA